MSREMTIYRRHLISCKYAGAGRDINRCKCPIWIQGVGVGSKRIRRSLGTSDWKAAARELAQVESGDKALSRSVKDCFDMWWESLRVKASTLGNYVQAKRSFVDFCGTMFVADVNFETVELWRNRLLESKLAPISANRQHTVIIVAFNWLLMHNYVRRNPAVGLKKLKVQPAEREPYSQAEVARLFAACEAIGRNDYERKRAKALLLLLYYTGLRISDIAMLSKDRVQNGRLILRTRKTGEKIDCPMPDALLAALAALPEPESKLGESKGTHFFWNGICKEYSVIHMCMRTLEAVFKQAGFEHCHLHRFRHTLASRVLANGGTIEDVAELLGNTPAVAHKHYSRFIPAWQKRLDGILTEATKIGESQPQPVIEQMIALTEKVQ